MRIEDKLRFHAEQHPNSTALISADGAMTYHELHEAVCRKAEAMEGMRGSLVPIFATPDADFLIAYLAAHLANAVAVPLAYDLPAQERERLVAAFAGKKAPEGVADILYTTGTTGKSKAVMVSHEAIFADAENLVEAQGFGPDLTFIINGPLNHIGSLSKVYPTLYVGGTIRIIGGMKDMNAFFRAIDEAPSKVATFLVPASIRMLMTFASDKLAACSHKLDFIETGAAPMSLSDMEKLCKLLPQTRLFNTYASTETGIISTFNYNAGECLPGCLGKPMRHSSLHITPEGLVTCQGKTLMSGYWNDDEATAHVLLNGTIVTNDLGTIDSEGRLRLQGRNDDVINIGGFKVAPTEVENVVLSHPSVKDCVCIGAEHPVMGKVLKLLVVPQGDYVRKDLVAFLKNHLEPHKIPVLYGEVEQVRRTFNGKIDRKSYAK